MPEIGTSGSMSGDGKRSAGHWPQATAPILDSTATSDSNVNTSPLLSTRDRTSSNRRTSGAPMERAGASPQRRSGAKGLSPLRSLKRMGTPGRSKASRRLLVR